MEAVADPWHWHWRPDVLLVLLAFGTAYVRGWRRLRAGVHGGLAAGWRLAAYLTGLAALAVALLSPLEHLAERLFTAHMVQHQLLLMVAPPCLLLANPFPFVVWGVRPGLRRALQRHLVDGRLPRRVLRALTRLPVAGVLYAGSLWAWHWPPAYEAALRHHAIHDLEHLTFFAAAVLFWWPVINPAPRARGARDGVYYGLRIAYLILATAQNTLLGAVLGLSERLLYPSYAAFAGELWGWSAVDDQAFGGGIMWSGGHMYLIAILALLWQAMNAEGRPVVSEAVDGRPRTTR
jgi:cytochrome c oxidase assembly factor CtaG